jgi:DNA-binding CsgD family transcriptional regulator
MPTRDALQRAESALVRACAGGLDVSGLRDEVLRSIRALMPVDAAFFATADPATLLFTSAYAEEPLAAASVDFLDNEFGGADVNRFSSLARSSRPVASLDGATGFDRWSSPRYREIMRPLGLGDELRAALLVGGACWGYLCLHREGAEHGFSTDEAVLLNRVAPHIAYGVRSAVLLAGSPQRPRDGRPGVVLLTEGLELIAATPEAEHLMDLLPSADAGPLLPFVVRVVARALLAQERAGSRVPSARVATATGSWLVVSASWLHGRTGERRISVVLAPARPADTMPLVLVAHGLTGREAQVARLVLRGLSTGEITDALHISRYTVQDHLKAVFDKVGVRSRGELAVRLLGPG